MVGALDFRDRLPGGEAAVLEYLSTLAAEGGELLARMWRTETLLPMGRSPLRGAMVNVRLPTSNGTAALAVGEALLARYRTWVPCFAAAALGLPRGSYWCRVSAYIYNDLDDFRMLGAAVAQILLDLKHGTSPTTLTRVGVDLQSHYTRTRRTGASER